MTWQATIASVAAQNLLPLPFEVPPPDADASVSWDATKKPASYTLSNSNRDVENVGINGVDGGCIALKPIPPWVGRVYFEIHVLALGPNVPGPIKIGVTGDVASHMYEREPNTIKNTGSIYTGEYDLHCGGHQYIYSFGLVPPIPAGSVVGVVIDPGEGKIWYLLNNVVIGPSGSSLVTGQSSAHVMANNSFYPYVKCPDNGDKMRLCSIPAEFTYPIPDGCRAYGSDLTNFTDYYLVVDNDQMSTGHGAGPLQTPWEIDPLGSTYDWHGEGGVMVHSFPIRTTKDGMVNFGQYYNPSFVRWNLYPNQAGKTWGTLYQDKVLDPRFADLIDNGEYVLRMSASIAMRINYEVIDLTISNAAFVASFYDDVDALISSQESTKIVKTRAGYAQRFFEVPPLTRKIRLGYKNYKPSTANTNSAGNQTLDALQIRVQHKQASLHRKIGRVRANGGAVSVILTP